MGKLSEYVVSLMDRKRDYSKEEMTVIGYGMELLFNSMIKIIIYMVVGVIIGKKEDVLFSLLIWCSIRKQSGGWHAKSDAMCFAVSGIAIFLPVVVSPYIKVKNEWIIIGVIALNIIYLVYAPYDEYYVGRRKEKNKVKGKTLLLINIVWILGSQLKEIYLYIAMFVLYEQGILLLHKK